MSQAALPAGSEGRLPDFLVVGAMKSGTSSLATWLDGHPGVFVAADKEVHFFERERNWERGEEWYRRQFAGAVDGQVAGEASPSYMFVPEAVDRMARLVPHARLLACLREPVSRAYSHYWHNRRLGFERRSFEVAVARELDGVPGGSASYLARGRYVDQLRRLEEHFPRQALLAVLTDDLAGEATATFRRVCRHLGVDDAVVPDTVGSVVNATRGARAPRLYRAMFRHRLWRWVPPPLRGAVARGFTRPVDYPPIDDATRARLAEWYREPNAALAEWLGRDLAHWG